MEQQEFNTLGKNARIGSIATAIGVLIMVVAFISFILLDRKKTIDYHNTIIHKDSATAKLYDSIQVLKPDILPIAYAVPTGKLSRLSSEYKEKVLPEYNFFLCLSASNSVLQKIARVDYFFDHPTFKHQHYISVRSTDSFTVSYKGWGCLGTILIFIDKKDGSKDTIPFPMCGNIRLKE